MKDRKRKIEEPGRPIVVELLWARVDRTTRCVFNSSSGFRGVCLRVGQGGSHLVDASAQLPGESNESNYLIA